MNKTIEVNGVLYVRNDPPERESSGYGRMSPILAFAMAMGGMGMYDYGSTYQRPRPVVDLPTEYGLIQLKKSKLSKSDRDWVVSQFEKKYTKVIKEGEE